MSEIRPGVIINNEEFSSCLDQRYADAFNYLFPRELSDADKLAEDEALEFLSDPEHFE